VTATATTASPNPVPPTPAITAQSAYRGFVVFDSAQGKYIAYNFDGSPLGFEVPTLSDSFGFNPDLVQVAGDALYIQDENKVIERIDAQGSHALNAITADDISAYKVSADEKQIAWSVDRWTETPPRSELWLANIDGSNAHAIVTSTASDNGEFLIERPYRWTADGKLLYTEIPTGIGGYILYRAWNSAYVYDPISEQSATLYRPDMNYSVCLSGIASDLSHIAFGCSMEGAGKVSLLATASNTTTPVPDLPEQGQAGDATFSPSGVWLAYAIARGDAEHERGQIAVVPVDLSSAPSIIATQDDVVLNLIGWIDEDSLLFFRTSNGAGSVWRVNRDGSDLMQMVTADAVVGLIR